MIHVAAVAGNQGMPKAPTATSELLWPGLLGRVQIIAGFSSGPFRSSEDNLESGEALEQARKVG